MGQKNQTCYDWDPFQNIEERAGSVLGELQERISKETESCHVRKSIFALDGIIFNKIVW